MPLLPGAEPFSSDGGPVGVLLCHGFTGSPQSLRPWAEYLAARGLTVSLPRLPGHGTSWQEMSLTRWPDWYATIDRAFDDLRGRCDPVVVMGLSMGGTLALRLAEVHGAAVGGLVLVNPSLLSRNKVLRLLPLLRLAVPTAAGVANDIKKADAYEVGYERVPLAALRSLVEFWKVTRQGLPGIGVPVLLYRSVEDHVVEPDSAAHLLRSIGSADVEERLCHDSYHVATLDNDAETIFAGSLDFVTRLARRQGVSVAPGPVGGAGA